MIPLTISIVTYHDYDDVLKAIETIEKYTSIEKKIYIIDNSCLSKTDKKRMAFEKALSEFKEIEYIDSGKNVGFGSGHNLVLNKLDSKYHAIVNPDVTLKEDAFSKLIEYMETHEDCGMCIPKIVDEQGKIQEAYRKELTVWDMFVRFFIRGIFTHRVNEHCMKSMDYTVDFDVPFAQGCFLLIHTDLYKKIDGFDERYFMYLEDADLCKRVNEIKKVKYVPDCSVVHVWKQGSHKNLRLFRYHMQSMVRYFNKWGWKWK